PRLIDRHSDIGLLARHFLASQVSSANPALKGFTSAALRKLESYEWPGNVRELFNVVQSAALFAEGGQVRLGNISIPVRDSAEGDSADDFNHARVRAVEAFEKRYVETLLRKHNGNVTRAAIEAGKDRRAFGRLKKKYGITI